MNGPTEAVILAAGLGTRFGGPNDVKQLAGFGLFGLIERNCRILEQAGLERVILVTGFRREEVEFALREVLMDRSLAVSFAHNPHYRKGNGISALYGAEAADGSYLLLMADHVFEPAILRDAVRNAPPESGGVLYVDRKIDEVFDLDDATKVRTNEQGRIVAIGKSLEDFDAVDTGLFVMTADLAKVLRRVYETKGDCSLSDGVQGLADAGAMWTRDIGPARWQDVDTLEALRHAFEVFGDEPGFVA